MTLQPLLRALPAVDELLGRENVRAALERHGRPLVVDAVRQRLDSLRDLLRSGQGPGSIEEVVAAAERETAAALADLDARAGGELVPVLNATGVIVHTNLGRAPLGAAAVRRLAELAGAAVNLELDLATGRRGRRGGGCEELLRRLTGAEAACVVNNNAAALLLALNTHARGRGVAVSRGELVEIGGSFRIPAICERSGARLVEVGTTNRTRLADYREALGEHDVALLLKVHPSNFSVVGFTEETLLDELVALGRERGQAVVMDQGSGALEDLSAWGVSGETPASRLVATGADLVLFSADKLLGGPQAGCLVGRGPAIEACRGNPLYRALRAGRHVLAALEATLWEHAAGRLDAIPVLAQLRASVGALRARAELVRDRVAATLPGAPLTLVSGESTSGGGSSPMSRIGTVLLRVEAGAGSDDLARRLRSGSPPVLARIREDGVLLDLRTVPPDRDVTLAAALVAALGAAAGAAPADVAASPPSARGRTATR